MNRMDKKNRELYTMSDLNKMTYDAEESNRTLNMDLINMKKSIDILNNQLSNEESLRLNLEQKLQETES